MTSIFKTTIILSQFCDGNNLYFPCVKTSDEFLPFCIIRLFSIFTPSFFDVTKIYSPFKYSDLKKGSGDNHDH